MDCFTAGKLECIGLAFKFKPKQSFSEISHFKSFIYCYLVMTEMYTERRSFVCLRLNALAKCLISI